MEMETEALRWFQEVADGVTVTEVAEAYQVSQPGVSRTLARLEAAVGTPLLRKQGRVLRPTHAGTVFKQHLDSFMHGLDDAVAAVDQLLDPESGTVTVAFQPSLGTWLVPGLIAAFRRDHPAVDFRLVQSDDAVGSSLVAGGRIDLELTARRPRNPAVRWERLLSQPFGLAVPADHRLAGHRSISITEAADEDFVALRPSWELRGQTDELCAAAGFAARVAFEADDLEVVRGFVAAGLGVAVVPTAPASSAREDGRGVRVPHLTDPGADRDVGLAWSSSRRLLPSAELFRRAVLVSAGRRE
jgi:LysR family transcriptional regulator, transcription activator of glutamate synthase operon